MRKFRLSSVLAMLLSALLLITSLPMAAFAVTPSIGIGAGTPNYDKFRGNGMTADANGVMVYDDLAAYKKTSQKDMALTVSYETKAGNATNSGTTTSVATYDECSVLYADYAIYYDDTIEGNTVKIRYGLSMMDSVQYVDKDGVITEGKSPIQLSASYKNDANPDWNAGYGMVDEDGDEKVDYTTRHYEEKAILFYIINHTSYERIGQEDDVSILQDYIDQGYVIVTLDFKSHANATSPYIEQALVSAQSMFKSCAAGTVLGNLGVTTSAQYIYCLPEGCRIERDVWFWDSSIWGAKGTMDAYRNKWNQKISRDSTYTLDDGTQPTFLDTEIGNLQTVEDMIAKVGQYVNKEGYSDENNGKPIEYKLSMNIIYPSQPKADYEVPVYVQEGTGYTREDGIGTEYKRGTFNAFALNGYACVQYDHDYWPFLYRWGYQFYNSGSDYTLGVNLPRNAQAAMRCVRSLADELGYSSRYLGAAGISKATVGMSALAIQNNENYPHSTVSYKDVLNNDKTVSYTEGGFEGDLRDEKGTVTHTILQPFSYYDDEHTEKISSDSCVTYISSGQGYERLFGIGRVASYPKVPLLVSGGLRDNYNCYNYWDESVEWFEDNLTGPWLPLTQLDQGHAYPVGDDTQFGYNRGNAMIRYFDVFLKPDANRAPEVLWATPFNGASDVACSTKWTVGPFTPYGAANWAPDSYYYPQAIQIRFLDAVDPDSVNSGVTVTVTETGAKVDGTWVASQNDALYTFECDALTPGTRYTIDITSGVEGKNGVALAETRKIGFKTEGTYALSPVADAYVSSNEPNKVFGSANKLQVSNAYTTLVSYDTEHILDANKIQLKANGSVEDTVNVEIFALADYKVDEATLTYNTLTASTAWANKISLGKYSLVDGNISIDLSALSAVEGLGKTVTLAVVSTDKTVSEKPYVFTNDFETPAANTALTKEITNEDETTSTITIVRSDGTVIRDTDASVGRVYSDYWYTATGADKGAKLVGSATIPIQSGSTRALGIYVNTGNNHMKFFNTLSDKALTAADIGKTFRVSVDVYTTQDVTLSVGVAVLKDVTGYSVYTNYNTETFAVKKETWTPITRLITITESMVQAQAGLVAFTANYREQVDDGTAETYYTYYDNMVVEECTPMLTVDSTETAGNDGFTLITTNPGAPLNQPITVTFDEAMDLSTFKKGMVVTNEKTGERIKGSWAAADDTNTVFTFTTNGLAANTTYTVATTDKVKTAAGVACTEEIVKTVATEGSYSLRPLATSYVSVANASTHYGLNADPVLDTDKLGVVTFSAKTLASAQIAKMYLGVDSAKNGAVRVYALNYTPDDTLCYNSVKDSLTDANLLGLYEVDANGTVGIDLSDLLDKTFGDTVTFVLKAGYVFTNDFETPLVSQATGLSAGSLAAHPANEAFSDKYVWTYTGMMPNADLMPATDGASQTLRVKTKGGQTTKFYNAIKASLLDANDVGRTYNISLKMRSSETTATPVGTVDKITVTAGFMNRVTASYGGTNYNNYTFRDTPTTRPSATLELGDTDWTTVSFTATVNQTMVNLQAGMLTLNIPKVADSSDANVLLYHFYDDILVEEVVTDSITVDKDSLILMTENTEIEDVTNEDNPVKDELYPSVLNKPIVVSFNTAMDLTTFEKGMVVTNVATGNRVDGTWSATDATNMNFAFTTRGFVAGATYTVATTAAVKTLGGTAVGGAVIKTVTMEGSYALKPLVTSYVSKSEPKQHFGLDTDLVLDTNKLGVVTFSAKTLADAEDAFLYMPWNATRKTFIYVYALADYLPDSTLCYDSIKAQLTDANLVLMDEWASGAYALDLNALADRDLGDNVTLVIKAGYTFQNDFETYRIENGVKVTKPLVNKVGNTINAEILSYGQSTYPDYNKETNPNSYDYGLNLKNTAYIGSYNLDEKDYANFWFTASGSSQVATIVNGPDSANSTQVLRTKLSYDKNGIKLYNAFRPGITLTEDDIGRTFNVSYDIRTPQSITIYTAPLKFNTGTSTLGASNAVATATTADTWTEVNATLTLTATHVTNQSANLGIQTPNARGNDTNTSYFQYFDNFLVEEVVSEFTLPADSFILVTENEASVDVTDVNPVVDEIYEDDVVVPEPPVESVETKITAAEVALGTSITVHYYATLNEDHAGAQMRFTVDGVKTLVDGVKSGKEYVYSYTGIAPQALGENIKAELIVDGEVVATKDEYSVLQNCKNLLAKTAAELGVSDEKYAAMRTLIADLLEYGAAAQLYVNHKTDALVNEGNEGATAFEELDGDEWSKMPTVTTDAAVDLISAGLHFNNTNKLYFRFEAADITEDNFKVTIDGNEYTLGDFELTDNGYILRTEDIAATELDHLFTIELIKNGETVQTLEYGVFAYVYNMQNNTSEAMATLAKTLYNYGVSADAYALAE